MTTSRKPTSRNTATRNNRLMDLSRLHLRKTIDASWHVAVVAGVGLQLEQHCERAGAFAETLERLGELVHHGVSVLLSRRRRLCRTFEPLDAALQISARDVQ